MSKNTYFFGQSVFGQLISLIDKRIISRNSAKYNADRYIKRFTTKDHLISMLFGVFAKITSLREVSGAMLGLSGKTKHFQLESLPYRSTLSDANKRRTSDVFAGIYNDLLKQYHDLLSDSRIKQVINKQIEIFDSTIISLFQDILKCVGRMPVKGKRKGGIKMHTIKDWKAELVYDTGFGTIREINVRMNGIVRLDTAGQAIKRGVLELTSLEPSGAGNKPTLQRGIYFSTYPRLETRLNVNFVDESDVIIPVLLPGKGEYDYAIREEKHTIVLKDPVSGKEWELFFRAVNDYEFELEHPSGSVLEYPRFKILTFKHIDKLCKKIKS